ncbi:hypothetical protein [Caulobacter phage Cr30]|uniref:hypothetical protein n=1 Tax=Caulobacter phage Cr30 TaxID=1357714 RepID=UPI0004A9B512|nr:hypothetical protein OZ74_gp036 [Caulobacter phage Cr30]AGS80921.1 hypothetical protein [Caulobacter phage Cr30]
MAKVLLNSIREHYGIGFFEAKKLLEGEQLRKRLFKLERKTQYDDTLYEIHKILSIIVERMYKQMPDYTFDEEIENSL